jgi:hypothetical protein
MTAAHGQQVVRDFVGQALPHPLVHGQAVHWPAETRLAAAASSAGREDDFKFLLV